MQIEVNKNGNLAITVGDTYIAFLPGEVVEVTNHNAPKVLPADGQPDGRYRFGDKT